MSHYQYFSGHGYTSINDRLKLPVAITLLSTLLCTAFYFLVLLLNGKAKTSSNIVALVHGYLLLAHAMYVIKTGSHHYTNPGTNNTDQEALLVSIALGYFLHDFGAFLFCKFIYKFISKSHLQVIKYKIKERLLFIIAYVLNIITLTLVLVKGQSAAEVIFGLEEIMLPYTLLLTLVVMQEAGYKGSIILKIIESTCFMSYLYMLVFIAFFANVVCAHPRPGLDIKACVVGWVLVVWWQFAKSCNRVDHKCIDTLPSVGHQHDE